MVAQARSSRSRQERVPMLHFSTMQRTFGLTPLLIFSDSQHPAKIM